MQGKLTLAAGFVAGYVLGSKAGRQRYEEIVAQARKVAGSQTVQSTAGVLQTQASELANKAKVSDVVAKAKQVVGRSSSDSDTTSGRSTYDTTPSTSTYTAPSTSAYTTETTPGAASGDLFEPSSTPTTSSTTTDPLDPSKPSNNNGSNL